MTDARFDSVWEALENSSAESANMKARSDLTIAIRNAVDDWQLTQAEGATRLGVTQSRMNDLLRGRIDKFNLDALTMLAIEAGLVVEWRIRTPVARSK
jgi:predicted XRE-type DNA-binding protein